MADANGLSAGWCGLTDGSTQGDWRLPNTKELQSLVDFGNLVPALPSGHPFTNVQIDYYYWSSTTLADENEIYAWYVYLADGRMSTADKDYYSYYIWPVRRRQ